MARRDVIDLAAAIAPVERETLNDRVYREMLGVSADDLESLRRDKII